MLEGLIVVVMAVALCGLVVIVAVIHAMWCCSCGHCHHILVATLLLCPNGTVTSLKKEELVENKQKESV